MNNDRVNDIFMWKGGNFMVCYPILLEEELASTRGNHLYWSFNTGWLAQKYTQTTKSDLAGHK